MSMGPIRNPGISLASGVVLHVVVVQIAWNAWVASVVMVTDS